MSASLKPLTLGEFLDWERSQPERYEFDGVQPIAMTGGTAAHAFIQRNLAISIGGRLRGQACKFVGNDLKIEVAGSIRYPMASSCAPNCPRRAGLLMTRW